MPWERHAKFNLLEVVACLLRGQSTDDLETPIAPYEQVPGES